MTPKQMTEAILKSLGKENDPTGVLIHAVIEKHFLKYEEALTDIDTMIREVDEENYSLIEELIRDKVRETKIYGQER